MADILLRAGTFAAGRYNALQGQPAQASFAVIMERVRNLPLESPDPGRDLLAFLRQSHTDPELAKACHLVLDALGLGATAG
jgi:hypothetical protein